jgi:hypothetical protein
MKSRLRWVGHLYTGHKRKAYKISVGKIKTKYKLRGQTIERRIILERLLEK